MDSIPEALFSVSNRDHLPYVGKMVWAGNRAHVLSPASLFLNGSQHSASGGQNCLSGPELPLRFPRQTCCYWWPRLHRQLSKCLFHHPKTVPSLLPAPLPHSPKFQSSIPQKGKARVSTENAELYENPGQTKVGKSVWCPIKTSLMLQFKKKNFFFNFSEVLLIIRTFS